MQHLHLWGTSGHKPASDDVDVLVVEHLFPDLGPASALEARVARGDFDVGGCDALRGGTKRQRGKGGLDRFKGHNALHGARGRGLSKREGWVATGNFDPGGCDAVGKCGALQSEKERRSGFCEEACCTARRNERKGQMHAGIEVLPGGTSSMECDLMMSY
eukprot:1158921-Pelagomonas_calceolata.AAC.8